MAGSRTGALFVVTTYGESHGVGVGAVVDGCPPGLVLDVAAIQHQLARRRPGQSHLVSQRKEADALKVPEFPTSASFPQWRQTVQRRLVSASARIDQAEVEWLAQACRDGVTLEDLANSGGARFEALDFKLSTAVIECIRASDQAKTLAHTLANYQTRAMNEGTPTNCSFDGTVLSDAGAHGHCIFYYRFGSVAVSG